MTSRTTQRLRPRPLRCSATSSLEAIARSTGASRAAVLVEGPTAPRGSAAAMIAGGAGGTCSGGTGGAAFPDGPAAPSTGTNKGVAAEVGLGLGADGGDDDGDCGTPWGASTSTSRAGSSATSHVSDPTASSRPPADAQRASFSSPTPSRVRAGGRWWSRIHCSLASTGCGRSRNRTPIPAGRSAPSHPPAREDARLKGHRRARRGELHREQRANRKGVVRLDEEPAKGGVSGDAGRWPTIRALVGDEHTTYIALASHRRPTTLRDRPPVRFVLKPACPKDGAGLAENPRSGAGFGAKLHREEGLVSAAKPGRETSPGVESMAVRESQRPQRVRALRFPRKAMV